MLDYAEYTIDDDSYQGNGHHRNGYDKLEGDWLAYYKVAKNFTHKVKPEDREDFLHDLFVAFASIKVKYQIKGKELTTYGLVRIAQYEVADYWRKWYKRNQNTTCERCSKAQRRKCKEGNLYSQCPKAIQLESLSKLIEDDSGNRVELCQLLADDKAVDLTARLDAKLTLESYPKRFVDLAYKKYAGYPLDKNEQNYYYREQRKAKKALIR